MRLRSVGLLQNAIEGRRLRNREPDQLADDHRRVGMPRAGYVRFPLGTPFGEPGYADLQRAILADLPSVVWEAPSPGTVVKFPYRWCQRLVAGRP